MGKHFGELYRIRGIVYYRLSPHELRAFGGAIKYGIPNIVQRAFPDIFYWLPPFIMTTAVYYGIEEMYHHSKRKNPKDYENEVDPNPPKVDCIPAEEKDE